ncbi:hypothetical protein PR003_g5649 [Phytophthora rubi]|nr:hypothetical protein PR001_g6462 [Phytophthora rubi]KAE9349901.1 hypothetical protein PR003_g5649 [Phytophthora rubi]
MHPSADSPATASATVTAVLGASTSSSSLSGLRKVHLSDRELLERVQRVVVPAEPVNFRALSAKRGWKHVRAGVASGMSMRFRVLRTGQTQSQQCQVVVGGDVHAQVSELVSLLRAPTENESNTLLHALYGSHFIYSSLVHAVTSPSSERDSLLSPRSRGSVVAAGQQLMVRTISFVHPWGLNHFKQQIR